MPQSSVFPPAKPSQADTPSCSSSPCVTRFAPSPTGFLHIGGARTALFNYLFAKNKGGKFLLRIEDTDKKRSTKQAIDAILQSMDWLGITPDEEPIFQSAREARHREIAQQLLAQGKAYYCYTTQEELAALREEASQKGQKLHFKSPYRDYAPSSSPSLSSLPSSPSSPSSPHPAEAEIQPVIRLKTPQEGKITIDDAIKGQISVEYTEIDDLILLRADGTPTYMFAVVIDDYDMGITDIIRGDDHFTNSFRQYAIYEALGWNFPKSCHLPLIHGEDGTKLSKRHGALNVMAYKEMGFLSDAVKNYLLRLGWSLGDKEVFATKEAMQNFHKGNFGKSPARFDMAKLKNINNHYIKELFQDDKLAEDRQDKEYGREKGHKHKSGRDRLQKLIEGKITFDVKCGITPDMVAKIIKESLHLYYERTQTINELAENIKPLLQKTTPSEKDAKILAEGKGKLAKFASILGQLPVADFHKDNIKQMLKDFVAVNKIKFKEIGLPLRVAILGVSSSPDIAEIIAILGKITGKEAILARLSEI